MTEGSRVSQLLLLRLNLRTGNRKSGRVTGTNKLTGFMSYDEIKEGRKKMPVDWSKLGGDRLSMHFFAFRFQVICLFVCLFLGYAVQFVENNILTGTGCPSADPRFKTTALKKPKSVQKCVFHVIFCQAIPQSSHSVLMAEKLTVFERIRIVELHK